MSQGSDGAHIEGEQIALDPTDAAQPQLTRLMDGGPSQKVLAWPRSLLQKTHVTLFDLPNSTQSHIV